MNQKETPLFDAIKTFIAEKNTPFFIPSHKMGRGIHPAWKEFAGEAIFQMDLCEVHGLDDLHQPREAIRDAQNLAAAAWGADQSFFLVNGTSSGIIASLCSVAGPGQKVIVPRNAHKSVIFGLIISGAIPIYAPAEIHYEKGLVGGLRPETLEDLYRIHPDVVAVLAVSPSYHGIVSDMAALAEITHRHGGVFIADEAHGNHVYFHEALPRGALDAGADLVCQSIHKMSGSLTQSSMLHLKGNRVDVARLKTNLQMVQNTSPSYLLEVSLDLARSYIATEGRWILNRLIAWLDTARAALREIDGIEVLDRDLIGQHGIFDYEPVRLIISARQLGLEGYELYELLHETYQIEIEFGDYFYAICVAGLGTTEQDIFRLIRAFQDISQRYSGKRAPLSWQEKLPPVPPMQLLPRDASYAEREQIPWTEAKGRISADMIVPYPPGIPTLCPGEEITEEIWTFLDEQNRNGRHLHGPKDGRLNQINVICTP